jgi:hypothetical protein
MEAWEIWATAIIGGGLFAAWLVHEYRRAWGGDGWGSVKEALRMAFAIALMCIGALVALFVFWWLVAAVE